MSIKNNISSISILCLVSLCLLFLIGCEDPFSVQLPKECHVGDTLVETKSISLQYEVSNGHDIFGAAGGYASMHIFKKDASTEVWPNVQNPVNLGGLELEVPDPGYQQDLKDVMATYFDFHKQINNGYNDGFIFALDSIYGTLNDTDKDYCGVTKNLRPLAGYSYVFSGKINRLLGFDHVPRECCLIHEIGHQFGINGHEEGCGEPCKKDCLMAEILNPDLWNNGQGVHFCRTHAAIFYGGVPDPMSRKFALNIPRAGGNIFHDNNQFTFSISLTNPNPIEYEPFYLTLVVKNVGTKDDSISNFTFFDYLNNFNLLDENGKSIQLGKTYATSTKSFPLRLKPNEEKSFSIDMLSNFGTSYLDSFFVNNRWVGNDSYIPIGKYVLNYIQTLGNIEIHSNELTFQILRPEGKDSLELNRLKSIYSIVKPREKIDSEFEFITKYPDSKYIEIAVRKYFSSYKDFLSNDFTNLLNLAKIWVEKSPNSIMASSMISILKNVKNKGFKTVQSNVDIFMKYVIDNYPNTSSSDEALKFFKNIK